MYNGSRGCTFVKMGACYEISFIIALTENVTSDLLISLTMHNSKAWVVYKTPMFLWTSLPVLVLIRAAMPTLQYEIRSPELLSDAITEILVAVWLWQGRAFQILHCQAGCVGRLVCICSYSLCYSSYGFSVVIIHRLSTVLWILHWRGIVANLKNLPIHVVRWTFTV